MPSNRGVFHLNPSARGQSSVFRGLILAMLSGVCFSITSVIVKQMKNLQPDQLSLYTFIGTFVMGIPEITKTGMNPLGPRKFRVLLALRGIFGALTVYFHFFSLQYLSLGEASVIIFSSPVFVTIFARVFFKEPCNIVQSIAVITTFIGITFTTKLPSRITKLPTTYTSDEIYGFLTAIFSMFCITTIHLIVRKTRSVHQSIVNFNYSFYGLLELIVLMAVFGNFRWQQCGVQSLYILLLGLFSYSGLIFVVLALQCDYAGPVATVRAAADIIMSFVWQIFIFHDLPDTYSIVGAILVSFSITLIGLGKWMVLLDGKLFCC